MARRGKKNSEESKGADIRPLTVSLNLILVVFFVYINTIAVEDDKRIKKALQSLLGTFSVMTGGIQLEKGEKISGPPQPVSMSDGKKANSKSISDELKKAIQKRPIRAVKKSKEDQALKGKLKSIAGDDGVVLLARGEDLVIRMSNSALFPSGSAELHREAVIFFGEIAPILKESNLPIQVEGHTDDQAITTKQYPSNWELSAARAVSVLKFLVDRQGIPSERLQAVGYGEYQPIMPNDTLESRSQNRRVNIVILGGLEESGDG